MTWQRILLEHEITVDQFFTLKDDEMGTFARKCFEVFGSHHAAVNTATYETIKARCNVQFPPSANSWGAWAPFPSRHINSIEIHVDDSVPDGIIRGIPRDLS